MKKAAFRAGNTEGLDHGEVMKAIAAVDFEQPAEIMRNHLETLVRNSVDMSAVYFAMREALEGALKEGRN